MTERNNNDNKNNNKDEKIIGGNHNGLMKSVFLYTYGWILLLIFRE